MSFWNGKRVLVTGGNGFIGSHVVDKLLALGAHVTATYRDGSRLHNLYPAMASGVNLSLVYADLENPLDCIAACSVQEIVLNLAGVVGGVVYNSKNHGKLFRENSLINLNILDAARQKRVERVLIVSSACVYPKDAQVPTPEKEGFRDLPEETNRGYGLAKRGAEYAAQAYAQQYGMKIAIARPYNAYGPRDRFGDDSGHVIGGLVARAVRGDNPLLVWGDGTPTRSFLYVEDAARGLLEVAEKYPVFDPLNLGTDEEISMGDLAHKIVSIAGSGAKLVFDPSKPNGQPRRNCDTSKAKEKIGFEAKIRLDEGLARTIAWYKSKQGVPA